MTLLQYCYVTKSADVFSSGNERKFIFDTNNNILIIITNIIFSLDATKHVSEPKSKTNYNKFFADSLDQLKKEGRYREFKTMSRK
jgi:hypothetical protein